MAEIDDINCDRIEVAATGDNCADRLLFEAQETRNVNNWTCMKELLVSLQQQINLSNGTGTLTETGQIPDTTLDLSGNTSCTGEVEATIRIQGTGGPAFNTGSVTRTGDVVVKCDGAIISTQPYNLSTGALGNDQVFSESQIINATTTCTGLITVELVNDNTTVTGGATNNDIQFVTIAASCV